MPVSNDAGAIGKVAIDTATSGDTTIVAAVAGRKIRVHSYVLVGGGTVTARFESGAGGGALSGQMSLYFGAVIAAPHNPAGWFDTVAGELLNLELSGAESVDGHLTYSLV